MKKSVSILCRLNWFLQWPSIAEYITIEYIKTMSWNAVTPLRFSSWLNINRDFIYSWQWVASSSESRPCITMYSKCIDELFLLFFFSYFFFNEDIIYQSLVNQYRRWISCEQKWNIHEYYFFFCLMNYFRDDLF